MLSMKHAASSTSNNSCFARVIDSKILDQIECFMHGLLRYFRLWFAFARFALLSELAFRGNFIMKMLVEVLWLIILLMFYKTIFASTRYIAGWRQDQYLFFVGCYF